MIEKLDELRNVFALVTSDSLQCDLETTAVKKPGAREGGNCADDRKENDN